MPFPIEEKLVIAVTSSALFDMNESDEVFKTKGVEAYRRYQKENIDNTLKKGVAFPFIRRILSLNKIFPNEQPVEVILFSKNSPDAGNRAMRSLQEYGLDISRFIFTSGLPNFQYLPAYNSTLFLTSNGQDTQSAIAEGTMLLFIGPLIAKLAVSSGQSLGILLNVGPALIAQEFGNLGTIFLGLPIALLLGFGKEAIGMTHSIGREPNVAIIIDKFGFSSPEARGVLTIFVIGSVISPIKNLYSGNFFS